MKRSSIIVALATALLALVAASAALAGQPRDKALYRYVGELTGKSSTSLTVKVQNGNRAALRSLLNLSQEQSFATDAKTVFLRWTKGIPAKVTIDDLAPGDTVAVNVTAGKDASFSTIAATPANLVGDHGKDPARPGKPLYLFRGTFVSTENGNVTIDVQGGNHHALRLMIGQQARQTFATGPETVFLHWAQRIPTVIDAGQLKVGDRIVIRVRAAGGLDLKAVQSTPAKRVADREPKAQESQQNAQA